MDEIRKAMRGKMHNEVFEESYKNTSNELRRHIWTITFALPSMQDRLTTVPIISQTNQEIMK